MIFPDRVNLKNSNYDIDRVDAEEGFEIFRDNIKIRTRFYGFDCECDVDIDRVFNRVNFNERLERSGVRI